MALSRTSLFLLNLGKVGYKKAVATIAKLDYEQRRNVARVLIAHGFAWVVAHSSEHFGELDAGIAKELIRANQDLGGAVVRNLHRFGGDLNPLLPELAKVGELSAVEGWIGAYSLSVDTARELVKLGFGTFVLEHLSAFPGLTPSMVFQFSKDSQPEEDIAYG